MKALLYVVGDQPTEGEEVFRYLYLKTEWLHIYSHTLLILQNQTIMWDHHISDYVSGQEERGEETDGEEEDVMMKTEYDPDQETTHLLSFLLNSHQLVWIRNTTDCNYLK